MKITDSEMRTIVMEAIKRHLNEYPTRTHSTYNDLEAVRAMDSMLTHQAAKKLNRHEPGWYAAERAAERERERIEQEKWEAEQEKWRAKQATEAEKQAKREAAKAEKARQAALLRAQDPKVIAKKRYLAFYERVRKNKEQLLVYNLSVSPWGDGLRNRGQDPYIYDGQKQFTAKLNDEWEVTIWTSLGGPTEIMNTHVKLTDDVEGCFNDAIKTFRSALPRKYDYKNSKFFILADSEQQGINALKRMSFSGEAANHINDFIASKNI